MDIYLVRNKDGKYLYVCLDGAYYVWVERQKAHVYTSFSAAHDAGMWAFDLVTGAEEKFEVEHLVVLRLGIDPYAMTGDKEPIRAGGYYYLPVKRGLEIRRVDEIIYRYIGRRSVVSIVTNKNAVPVKPADLYAKEAAARRARHEKMAIWAYEDKKEQ